MLKVSYIIKISSISWKLLLINSQYLQISSIIHAKLLITCVRYVQLLDRLTSQILQKIWFKFFLTLVSLKIHLSMWSTAVFAPLWTWSLLVTTLKFAKKKFNLCWLISVISENFKLREDNICIHHSSHCYKHPFLPWEDKITFQWILSPQFTSSSLSISQQ